MSDAELLAYVTGLPVVVGLGVHGLHVRAVGPDFTITLAPQPRPVSLHELPRQISRS